MQPEAFFLPLKLTGSKQISQRFCLYYPAQRDIELGLVIYVHPFAEEMNKARRMAALQSRAFAQAGFSVLQIDLLGCGDSSGDFADATWRNWVYDVVQGCRWLLSHRAGPSASGDSTLWMWGLRAGCLVAVEAARELNHSCNFLFWQPPATGKPLLQQFMRLKAAGNMLDGQSKGVMEIMRKTLANGSTVEIAGYMLSPALASGLEQADLSPPNSIGAGCRLEWFELSKRDDFGLSPVSVNTISKWQQAGFHVGSRVVHGPAFWQTSEIEEAPDLVAATTNAVLRIPHELH